MTKIQYTNTIEDIIEFAEFCFENSQTRQTHMRRMRVITLVGMILMFAIVSWIAKSYTYLILGTIAAVAFFIQYPDMIKRIATNLVKRPYLERDNKAVFAARHLTVEPDKIKVTTEYGESTADWKVIEKVMENAKYIFIYTTSSAAYIIPKSSIPAEMLEDFTTRIKKYYQNAKERKS